MFNARFLTYKRHCNFNSDLGRAGWHMDTVQHYSGQPFLNLAIPYFAFNWYAMIIA